MTREATDAEPRLQQRFGHLVDRRPHGTGYGGRMGTYVARDEETGDDHTFSYIDIVTEGFRTVHVGERIRFLTDPAQPGTATYVIRLDLPMSRPTTDAQASTAAHHRDLPGAPEWEPGPLPVTHGDIRADTTQRSTYYPPRTARLLYGTADTPRRWHLPLNERLDGITLQGVEALRLAGESDAPGLLVVHLCVRTSHLHHVVRALAGRADANLDGYTPARFAEGYAELLPDPPYTIALVTPSGWRLPRLFTGHRHLRWPVRDQWLWAIASRTNQTDHPPAPHDRELPTKEQIWLSADWCGLILRQGMALVGTRPDRGQSDPFYNHAVLYTRTLYLDAVLISLLQLQGIAALEEALASAVDQDPRIAMAQLQQRLNRFRHELWWQHLTTRGAPNQILGALHRQHRLKERFDQVLAEINDYNQFTRDTDNRNINSAIVLFTLVTVPAGIALALLQALGSSDPMLFATVLVTCLIITALLLTTRPARTAMRSIRRRFNT
jgi:hypothetical protein